MVDDIVPPNYAPDIGDLESPRLSTDATNKYWPVEKGGPLGKHQFIASTWNAFAAANPDLFKGMTPDQILAARTDPNLSTQATNWYAGVNAKQLARNGIPVTPQNLAIAHALGGGGASMALKYDDSTPLTKIFKETQPNAADAILRMNPQYQKMTLAELKNKYAGIGTTPYNPSTPVAAPTAAAQSAQVAQATPATTALEQGTQYASNLAAQNSQNAQLQRLALMSKVLQPTQVATASPFAGSITPWAKPMGQPASPLSTVLPYLQLASLNKNTNPLTDLAFAT